MTDQITQYIITLAPTIGAVATIIVAVIKMLKSFGDKLAPLKKEVNEKFADTAEKLKSVSVDQGVLLTKMNNILEDNETLRAENAELKEQMKEVIALKNDIAALSDNVNTCTNTVTKKVKEQMKAEKAKLEREAKDEI